MSIATVRAAIQDVTGAVSGVKYAPDTIPNILTTDELPAVLAFTADGDWIHETFGPEGEACRRNWDVKVYVAPVGTGEDGEIYTRAETLLQAMGSVLVNKCDLDAGVWHDWTIRDSGVIADERIAYAGQQYIGFIFRLNEETWE